LKKVLIVQIRLSSVGLAVTFGGGLGDNPLRDCGREPMVNPQGDPSALSLAYLGVRETNPTPFRRFRRDEAMNPCVVSMKGAHGTMNKRGTEIGGTQPNGRRVRREHKHTNRSGLAVGKQKKKLYKRNEIAPPSTKGTEECCETKAFEWWGGLATRPVGVFCTRGVEVRTVGSDSGFTTPRGMKIHHLSKAFRCGDRLKQGEHPMLTNNHRSLKRFKATVRGRP